MASVYPARASLPQQASIVSRWLLDEASGNRADSVGSNTLTDGNTVAAGAGLSKPGGTLFDNSADFEYSNSEDLYCNDAASLSPTGAFTVSLWLKPESLTNAMDVINKWDNGNSKTFRVSLATSGYLQFVVSETGTSETTTTVSSLALSAGTWYHIVCVYRPSTELEIYINGVSRASNTTSIPASINDNTSKFQISNLSHGVGYTNWIDGLVQDAIFWNGAALTDAEVTTLYNLYSNKTLTETLTLSELIAKATTLIASETLTLSEVFAGIRGKIAAISETLTLADSVIKATVKSAVETLTVTASAIKGAGKMLTDSATVSDAIDALRLLALTITETITLVETKLTSITRSLSESITISDSKIASFFLSFLETLTITDSFTALLSKARNFIARIIDSPKIRGGVKPFSNRGKIK